VSEVGRRNRRRDGAAASLGKYYPSSAHSDAFADTNGGTIGNIDIFTGAGRSAAGIALSDVRVSDLECDAGQVNTTAARAKREGASLLRGCPAWIRTKNRVSKEAILG
jgi:hypothetical protein